MKICHDFDPRSLEQGQGHQKEKCKFASGLYFSKEDVFTNANGVRLCHEDEPGSIVQAQGHCLKMRNYCLVNLVMKTIRSLNLTHKLPVTCKSVLTLTFGSLCKFIITRRKTVYPFISNREILSQGRGIISELA